MIEDVSFVCAQDVLLPGQHFIENQAHAVKITRLGHFIAARLLRRQIAQAAFDLAVLGVAFLHHGGGDTKIPEFDVPLAGQEYVSGIDVPVNNTFLMGFGQTSRQLNGDVDRLVRRRLQLRNRAGTEGRRMGLSAGFERIVLLTPRNLRFLIYYLLFHRIDANFTN